MARETSVGADKMETGSGVRGSQSIAPHLQVSTLQTWEGAARGEGSERMSSGGETAWPPA